MEGVLQMVNSIAQIKINFWKWYAAYGINYGENISEEEQCMLFNKRVKT